MPINRVDEKYLAKWSAAKQEAALLLDFIRKMSPEQIVEMGRADDMAYITSQIREINDQLYHRGEYADGK